jgi:hypothetical protein
LLARGVASLHSTGCAFVQDEKLEKGAGIVADDFGGEISVLVVFALKIEQFRQHIAFSDGLAQAHRFGP